MSYTPDRPRFRYINLAFLAPIALCLFWLLTQDYDNDPQASNLPVPTHPPQGQILPTAEAIELPLPWQYQVPYNPDVQYNVPEQLKQDLSKFLPSVGHYWQELFYYTSQTSNIDPLLLATIMQMGSCGDKNYQGEDGRLGLFALHPSLLEEHQDPNLLSDPVTSGIYFAKVFKKLTAMAGANVGQAFIGYFVGPEYMLTPDNPQNPLAFDPVVKPQIDHVLTASGMLVQAQNNQPMTALEYLLESQGYAEKCELAFANTNMPQNLFDMYKPR